MDGTILVTGASGFVGAGVARALLARGAAVRVLIRPQSSRANLEGLDVEIAEGDLDDPDSLRRAVRGVSGLFHVAADYRLWTRDPAAMFRTNVEGSAGSFLPRPKPARGGSSTPAAWRLSA